MGMNVGSGGGGSDMEPMMDINTTPLIDVMLVLIIMLIITIPIQLHSVNMEMPVGNPPNREKPLEVRIDIDRTGQIFWNGSPIDRPTLDANMIETAKISPQPNIMVRPDRAARYEGVAFVLANSQRRGLQKLAIIGGEQFR
ncbi:MAG: biopolymer transporter ExbD [Rhodocyclaceae bacterium]|nr:biopolymer transporter ExbD [Rhodocyclaceae bacterium]